MKQNWTSFVYSTLVFFKWSWASFLHASCVEVSYKNILLHAFDKICEDYFWQTNKKKCKIPKFINARIYIPKLFRNYLSVSCTFNLLNKILHEIKASSLQFFLFFFYCFFCKQKLQQETCEKSPRTFISNRNQILTNPVSANPTKWSNTLWGWRLKG